MPNRSRILTINGGSSTIKFAVFSLGNEPERILRGSIDRIGSPEAILTATAEGRQDGEKVPISAANHREAAGALIGWIANWNEGRAFAAIGHRVVHGGVKLNRHQIVTPALVEELCRTRALDLAHLPREIALIEAFRDRFTGVPQIACFDTAFHRDLPRIAQLLPVPRRYTDAGVRRLGFHGLSLQYLTGELRRIAGAESEGRVIMAHLGSGASMTALREGRPVDTSMAFTPTAGLMMGTRPGDLDPGLLVYMMRTEGLTAEQMDEFISHRCGLAGVAGGDSDMRQLIARRGSDANAAEAVDLFCYQAKKWIGAYSAVLGGLDTLVFSGGIGERSPEVRGGICTGLEYLGLQLDAALNRESAPVISAPGSRVTVRVIPTDEELMVANITCGILAERAETQRSRTDEALWKTPTS